MVIFYLFEIYVYFLASENDKWVFLTYLKHYPYPKPLFRRTSNLFKFKLENSKIYAEDWRTFGLQRGACLDLP